MSDNIDKNDIKELIDFLSQKDIPKLTNGPKIKEFEKSPIAYVEANVPTFISDMTQKGMYSDESEAKLKDALTDGLEGESRQGVQDPGRISCRTISAGNVPAYVPLCRCEGNAL